MRWAELYARVLLRSEVMKGKAALGTLVREDPRKELNKGSPSDIQRGGGCRPHGITQWPRLTFVPDY
jgi:hypothetical protein